MDCKIIDYGTGNIQSVYNALKYLGHTVSKTNDPNEFKNCDCLIFPGQGAFGPAIKTCDELNIIKPLTNYIKEKKPFIGICLGFQLLFDESSESINDHGLGAFKGQFKQFDNTNLVVPHMGWNTIQCPTNHPVLSQFNNQYVYFVHSFYLPTTIEPHFCTTNYGQPFISAIANNTQLATQFHPEKSGNVGLELLDTFLKSL